MFLYHSSQFHSLIHTKEIAITLLSKNFVHHTSENGCSQYPIIPWWHDLAMVNKTLILTAMCCKNTIIYVLQTNLTWYEKDNARFGVATALWRSSKPSGIIRDVKWEVVTNPYMLILLKMSSKPAWNAQRLINEIN